MTRQARSNLTPPALGAMVVAVLSEDERYVERAENLWRCYRWNDGRVLLEILSWILGLALVSLGLDWLAGQA